MLPINPALIITGPALIQYRGKAFYSKDDIKLTPKLDTFEVNASRFNKVQDRESTLTFELKFTPVGTFDALSVLWPYGNSIPGDYLHRVKSFGAVDDTANTVTIAAHGFRDGEQCMVASFGTLPAPLSAATVYFLHKVDADTIEFYDTEADALAGGATGRIDLSDMGTGTHRVIEMPYLVIWSFDGVKYTFTNAVVSGMPDLNAAATEQPMGEVTVEAFRKFATAPTAADAFCVRTLAANTDASFDPAAVITQPYQLIWGGAAPWNAMSTKAGAKLSFGLELTPVTDDVVGIITRRIDGITAQCVARPNNVDEATLLAALTVQGAGAGRGRTISGNNLDIQNAGSTPLYVRLYGASIKDSTINWDGKEDRISDITWVANRTITGGAFNPLFAIQTTALS